MLKFLSFRKLKLSHKITVIEFCMKEEHRQNVYGILQVLRAMGSHIMCMSREL